MRWQNGTVTRIVRRSPTVSSFFFKLPEFIPFVAGQHVSVRLTAPDGYRAQRSYSIASAPEETAHIELAIEKLVDGEVSAFFHEVVEVNDEIEVSEPIGGYFVWPPGQEGPLLLIAGGSGVAPFISMARHKLLSGLDTPVLLLFSARTHQDLLFRDELAEIVDRRIGFDLLATLTRDADPPAGVRKGRIDAAMIAEAIGRLPSALHRVYVCGSNPFVENAAQLVVDAGVPPGLVATERYGV
ncbi:MAG: ferredoxin reductase [Rhizobiaceae bacterium]|nr:ferredoxin reductase [Rhizobiaceae bacterium]